VLGSLLRMAINDMIGHEIGIGDRLGGALLGAIRVGLIAVTLVLIFDQLVPANRQPAYMTGSHLRPLLSLAGQKGVKSLPPDVPPPSSNGNARTGSDIGALIRPPYQRRQLELRPLFFAIIDNFRSDIVDLGIKGRRALVCASSKGLGRGCAEALAAEGVHVTMTARGGDVLAEAAAADIRKAYPGVEVTEVVGDITTVGGPRSRAEGLPARSTSSSTMPAARRPAISATGPATTGSRPSTPTC
jgi:hypothetical protein